MNQPRHNSPILVLHSKQLLSFIRGIFMNNSLDYPFEAIRCQSEVAQSCLTLCDPMDCSPPGSFHPWNFLGKSTGVGCHYLLQGIFPSQGSNQGPTLQTDTLPSEPPGNQAFTNHKDSKLNIRDDLPVMYLICGSYVK